MMPQLLFADGTHSVNLVTQDYEGNLGKLLDGQKRVELCFRLGETLEIGGVDEEDDTVNFREVIPPKTTG